MKKKYRRLPKPDEPASISGNKTLSVKKKRKKKIRDKPPPEEYIASDYSIALKMSEYRKQFGVQEWWVNAEKEYNKFFGTDHTKLQEIVQNESNVM